jgi:hypothetical protein
MAAVRRSEQVHAQSSAGAINELQAGRLPAHTDAQSLPLTAKTAQLN